MRKSRRRQFFRPQRAYLRELNGCSYPHSDADVEAAGLPEDRRTGSAAYGAAQQHQRSQRKTHLEPRPKEWEAHFDLVHRRSALFIAADME
ncbi:hypothetical protein M440DRAFT_1446803 [Trichoderma longibrachiatum ATCC 18648]|uniref:Uncharacterized protein n=1 Tax=Trichoderma longibrachiatum ATCC 18648 TaxID=983965 RepID=A0A2T4BVJ4_TRILO|nr:hypothetical protein M440DRAFT_1446803 [Trichoderma longibrachiatum ATCC 18648]